MSSCFCIYSLFDVTHAVVGSTTDSVLFEGIKSWQNTRRSLHLLHNWTRRHHHRITTSGQTGQNQERDQTSGQHVQYGNVCFGQIIGF